MELCLVLYQWTEVPQCEVSDTHFHQRCSTIQGNHYSCCHLKTQSLKHLHVKAAKLPQHISTSTGVIEKLYNKALASRRDPMLKRCHRRHQANCSAREKKSTDPSSNNLLLLLSTGGYVDWTVLQPKEWVVSDPRNSVRAT